ncbi:unnamed protein product [marine sediment metagenome]|uniref:Uncharacterized protein n=1 Tax=marine sediment metagenome TaxID=412755 RepID=X1CM26_9ZZZZ
MKVIQIQIDDTTHQKLKVAVAQNGESIKNAIINAIKYYIETTKQMQKNGKDK